MKNVKGSLGQLGIFNKNSNAQQLIIGSVAGYVTGYLTMKVGKKAAFVVGTGIIVFQIAQNQGLTKANWKDAKAKAKDMQTKMNDGIVNCWRTKATEYAKNNTCFAASFAGGFLIGIAVV